MNYPKTGLTVLLCCAGLLAAADNPLELHHYQLDNGFNVYLNPDATQNSVKGGVMVKGGSKRDPKDATGIAHYFEHIMFKGTTQIGTIDYEKEKPLLDSIALKYEELSATEDEDERKAIQLAINALSIRAAEYAIPNELNKILETMGGTEINAYTSYDRIFYHNEFPANQMEKWLEVYSHRFQEPVFRLFQSELETVYEEKNMYADGMLNQFLETFMKELLGGSPYGDQTIIGSTEHLKNPSLQKMRDYFETYYVPNNMALILSGNFDLETTKPLIEEKFGSLERGPDPAPFELTLHPLEGRKESKHRLSPIRIGVLGFHGVPIDHPDRTALEVCDHLLANQAGTGLLDQLTDDQKVLAAGSETLMCNADLGAHLILFVPKLIGQSMSKAEELVWEQVERLQTGDFDEELLKSTQLTLTLNHARNLETGTDRLDVLSDLFVNNMNWTDYLQKPERINAVTKEDIMRVATQYYGKNHLAFHSRTGFPKKDKLEKPPYKPLQPANTEAKSAYAKQIEALPTLAVAPDFIEEGRDYERRQLREGATLYWVENPLNNLFTLRWRFQTGTGNDLNLLMLDDWMEYGGCDTLDYQALKKELHKLGGSLSFSLDVQDFTVTLEGPEEALPELLTLLNQKMSLPTLSEKERTAVINSRKSEKKLISREPRMKQNILSEFVRMGDQSIYLNYPSIKEMKTFDSSTVQEGLQKVLRAASDLHYAGQRPLEEVADLLDQQLEVLDQTGAEDLRKVRRFALPESTTVHFLHDAKAVQSVIYLMVPSQQNRLEDELGAEIFSRYFSQGMSSLVFQEIREFRSLAYATGGNYSLYADRSAPGWYMGYMTTQADKTTDALEAFTGMLNQLPEKPERMDFIKQNLQQSFNSERPEFRALTLKIPEWEWAGFSEDPKKTFLDQVDRVDFALVRDFHERYIKGQPQVIIITGNRKKIDLAAIEKLYGPVVEHKFKDIYRE